MDLVDPWWYSWWCFTSCVWKWFLEWAVLSRSQGSRWGWLACSRQGVTSTFLQSLSTSFSASWSRIIESSDICQLLQHPGHIPSRPTHCLIWSSISWPDSLPSRVRLPCSSLLPLAGLAPWIHKKSCGICFHNKCMRWPEQLWLCGPAVMAESHHCETTSQQQHPQHCCR